MNRITAGRGSFGSLTVNTTATIAACTITTLDVSSTATIAALNMTTLDVSSSATIASLSVTSTVATAELSVTSTATVASLAVTSTATAAELSVTSTATIASLSVTSTVAAAQLSVTSTATVAALTIGAAALTAGASELNELDLSVVGGVRKIKSISVTNTSSSETDTGWTLPTYGVVEDVALKVTTASSAAGYTMSVGLLSTTSGDLDGFLADVSTTATGLVMGYISCSTSGDTVNNLGAYLQTSSTTLANHQHAHKIQHNLSDSIVRGVSYTPSSSGAPAFAGEIVIWYTELTT